MCELNEMLKIKPPRFFTGKNDEEIFVSRKHKCSYCHGNGNFGFEQVEYHKYKKEICPVCNGSGLLQARITVSWIPEEIKN